MDCRRAVNRTYLARPVNRGAWLEGKTEALEYVKVG